MKHQLILDTITIIVAAAFAIRYIMMKKEIINLKETIKKQNEIIDSMSKTPKAPSGPGEVN